jgi:DNA helicase II / ATP-dependent DNA helicase PcrA
MSKILSGLNEAQLNAVTGADGPTIVIAGAGSGKTRVLTTRIAYLLEQGVRSWEILALTFTNKAAGEMKERIAQMIGDSYVHELWMGTFHSIFARILRRNAEAIGYTRSFSIYDTDDTNSAIKRIMDVLGIPKDKYNPNAIRSRISGAKNALVLPQQYHDQALDDFSEKTSLVYSAYTRLLGESNAMDFDDLLIKTIELFERHPDILATYQNRFRYILVDEYQDTNRAQYTVVKMLADMHKNLTVVGDDAQSIYAFRGADIKNIFLFQEDYTDAKLFRLEQNYRSTSQILAAANALIKNNKSQIEKNLFTKNPKGEAVHIIECSDDREEGAAVVRFLEDEMRKERYSLNEFAVLYRTNAQSRVIEDSFRRQGIPYTIVGGVAFYKRKEIKDVIAYIRLIVNASDSESLFRVINYPARGIGDTTLDKLAQFARERQTSVFDVLAIPEFIPNVQTRTINNLRAFHSLISKYRSLRAELSPSELLRSLIDETGILRELKFENTLESLARYENVREFLSAITEYFM